MEILSRDLIRRCSGSDEVFLAVYRLYAKMPTRFNEAGPVKTHQWTLFNRALHQTGALDQSDTPCVFLYLAKTLSKNIGFLIYQLDLSISSRPL